MISLHDRRYPGETDAYRAARDALLAEEMALRRQVEAVARHRRDMPLGGRVARDYVFSDARVGGDGGAVAFSALFQDGKDSLVVYSLMYRSGAKPCPMCTAFLDSLNGNAVHIRQRVNLAVVARASVGELQDFAASRGWDRLPLLSSADNTYNTDYFAEAPDGDQLPALNVFERTGDGIFHTYGTEMFFVSPEAGQHPRHVDALWPLWNVFDLTRAGRGENWWPQPSYG